jgi:WXXGXW repeat (2 copies)
LQVRPVNPRSLQQQSIIGHAKDLRAKGNPMRIASSIRPLLFAFVMLCLSAASFAQIGVAITIGPPPLPVYEQPLCPGEGYLWTPGYWAYDYDVSDYYWVPGTWVAAPEVGFLWTPAYWGWGGDGFVFYDGYWGPHVGFYGGINYGFGYFGEGYEGGRWDNGRFFYNRSVNNVNIVNIHNVYNTTIVNDHVNRVSYNGGRGGINARPRPEDEAAARERHIPPVGTQNQHAQAARANPEQRASGNMGRPGIAATPRPGDFNDHGAVPAKEAGGPYTPANRTGDPGRSENTVQSSAMVHPHDLPAFARNAPNTGKPKQDKKYEQQQEKQIAKQQVERDKLQQKQDQEHQQLAKRNAPEGQKQQVEQQHQQQTQQLQQRHQQEQQELHQKQEPAKR